MRMRSWHLSIQLLFEVFAFSFCIAVGGLGFEFCVFVIGWRRVFGMEPFITVTIFMAGA